MPFTVSNSSSVFRWNRTAHHRRFLLLLGPDFESMALRFGFVLFFGLSEYVISTLSKLAATLGHFPPGPGSSTGLKEIYPVGFDLGGFSFLAYKELDGKAKELLECLNDNGDGAPLYCCSVPTDHP